MARKIEQYLSALRAAEDALEDALNCIFTPTVVKPNAKNEWESRMLRYGAQHIEPGIPGHMIVSGSYNGCGEYDSSEQIPIPVLNAALEVMHSRPIQEWYTLKCEADEAAKQLASRQRDEEKERQERALYEIYKQRFG